MKELPVPEGRFEPEHADDEVEKANHFAWNLRVNVVVELFWGFALSLVSMCTIVPVFLAGLGASKRLIALIPGINLVGYALLQLPASYFTTRLRRKMPSMIWLHVPIVLAWIGSALVARNIAPYRPDTARWLFVAGVAIASLTGGIGVPMWADFLNRQTPSRTRGRFFGWAFCAGSLAALAGGWTAREILGRLAFPHNFSLCFYVGGSAMFVGLLPYMLVRETPVEPMRFASVTDYARHVTRAIARHSTLRRLLAARSIMEAGMMASAFYAVRALSVHDLPDSAAGTFTMIATAAQVPAMLAAGYFGERHSFRPVLAAAGVFGALATMTALLADSPGCFYLVFVGAGFALACDLVSTLNLLIEISPDRDKTIYQAIYNMLLMPSRIVYPVLGGALAEHLGLPAVFKVALILQLLGALLVIVLVRDPRGSSRTRGEGVCA